MFSALLWTASFFTWGKTRAWINDYFAYYNGTGYKKMPVNHKKAGEFIECDGTLETIETEIGKLPDVTKPIRIFFQRRQRVKEAIEVLEVMILNLTAEWRTYLYQNGYDTLRMPDYEMVRVTDLAYNRWRSFQAAVHELYKTSFDSAEETMCVIDGFIRDQLEALELIKMKKRIGKTVQMVNGVEEIIQ